MLVDETDRNGLPRWLIFEKSFKMGGTFTFCQPVDKVVFLRMELWLVAVVNANLAMRVDC